MQRTIGVEGKVNPYLGIDYQDTVRKKYMSRKVLEFSINRMSRRLNL